MTRLLSTDLESVSACPVCSSVSFEGLLDKADMVMPGNRLSLTSCRDCGFVFLNPRPSLSAMAALEDESPTYVFSSDETAATLEALDQLVESLESLTGRFGRLLDVGCNRGFLLEAAHRRGWEVMGIELSAVARDLAEERYGHRVVASFDELSVDARFDLITCWHVIEHVANPIALLRQVLHHLGKDAVLALQVPSFEELGSFIDRGSVANLICAAHNGYFTPRTLHMALERAGFEVTNTIAGNSEDLTITCIARPSLAARRSDMSRRIDVLAERTAERYWWFRQRTTLFDPPVFDFLTDAEWKVVMDWYDDTDRNQYVGECGIPLISLMHGLIMGNAVSSIVELGHYAGFSTLLMGFMARRMGLTRAIWSVDIDPNMVGYTRQWVEQAGLGDVVQVIAGDSRDRDGPELARRWLSAQPQLVFVDSAHEAAATVEELHQWYEVLSPGGLIVLHDVSDFATTFDSTGGGGVRGGLAEWRVSVPEARMILLNETTGDGTSLTYTDACGVGIIQKPLTEGC